MRTLPLPLFAAISKRLEEFEGIDDPEGDSDVKTCLRTTVFEKLLSELTLDQEFDDIDDRKSPMALVQKLRWLELTGIDAFEMLNLPPSLLFWLETVNLLSEKQIIGYWARQVMAKSAVKRVETAVK
jgi:hypothetical protein